MPNINVSIRNISDISNISLEISGNTLTIYSGVLQLDSCRSDDSTRVGPLMETIFNIRSFIPLDKTQLGVFNTAGLLNMPIILAPQCLRLWPMTEHPGFGWILSSMAIDYSLFWIQSKKLIVEPHQFFGVEGSKNVLVLSVTLQLLNSSLVPDALAYHISVAVPDKAIQKPVSVNPEAAP